jgi:hypothetical protein
VRLGALARGDSPGSAGYLAPSGDVPAAGIACHPGCLVDAMSGGWVELGIGAGWFHAEHVPYGIPFPEPGERFDQPIEQVAIVDGYGVPRSARPIHSRAAITD